MASLRVVGGGGSRDDPLDAPLGEEEEGVFPTAPGWGKARAREDRSADGIRVDVKSTSAPPVTTPEGAASSCTASTVILITLSSFVLLG